MNLPVTLHTYELNGKRIAYCSKSVFKVQVGRYAKGKYKTRWSFKGNIHKAVLWYQGINIGNGYKKRLFCDTFNKPVILKAIST